MNQIKQPLALMLLAVMLLSLMIPVSAIDDAPDQTTPRVLTIFKYRVSGQEGETFTPAPGVTFDIYRYGDHSPSVHETLDWEKAKAWTAGHPEDLASSVTTGEDGKAKWQASSEGTAADAVYLVMERTDSSAPQSGQSDPFLISLPYFEDDEDSWTYDVEVRVKNRIVSGPTIEKDVDAVGNDHAGANIGEKHTWIIQATVPEDLYYLKQAGKNEIAVHAQKHEIQDVLDTRLDYEGGLKVSVFLGDSEASVLNEEDYTLSGTAEIGKPGGTLIVTLSEAGMRHIMDSAGNTSAVLHVTFESSINQTASAGETIPNTARVEYTNAAGYSYEPATVPEDHIPEVHTGGFKLEKVDKEDTSKKLSGAEFHLAASETDARNQAWIKDRDGKDIVLITDTSGRATCIGLGYDSNAASPQGGTYYYLVETKAPSGYVLDNTPARITVNADTLRDTAEAYQIPNSLEGQQKPTMPLTGNAAKVGLWVIGMGFILAAGALGYWGLRTRDKS